MKNALLLSLGQKPLSRPGSPKKMLLRDENILSPRKPSLIDRILPEVKEDARTSEYKKDIKRGIPLKSIDNNVSFRKPKSGVNANGLPSLFKSKSSETSFENSASDSIIPDKKSYLTSKSSTTTPEALSRYVQKYIQYWGSSYRGRKHAEVKRITSEAFKDSQIIVWAAQGFFLPFFLTVNANSIYILIQRYHISL